MADTKTSHKCSKCKKTGHNSRTCPTQMAEEKVETKPIPQPEQKVYIVLHGGASKDWNLPNEVLAVCATLEDAADAINERIKFYMEEETHDEEDNMRKTPTFTAEDIKNRIDADKFSSLIQIVNIKADPEEEEDNENGMWGNLRISIQATPRKIRNNHSG
jgi:hypothetical protein